MDLIHAGTRLLTSLDLELSRPTGCDASGQLNLPEFHIVPKRPKHSARLCTPSTMRTVMSVCANYSFASLHQPHTPKLPSRSFLGMAIGVLCEHLPGTDLSTRRGQDAGPKIGQRCTSIVPFLFCRQQSRPSQASSCLLSTDAGGQSGQHCRARGRILLGIYSSVHVRNLKRP